MVPVYQLGIWDSWSSLNLLFWLLAGASGLVIRISWEQHHTCFLEHLFSILLSFVHKLNIPCSPTRSIALCQMLVMWKWMRSPRPLSSCRGEGFRLSGAKPVPVLGLLCVLVTGHSCPARVLPGWMDVPYPILSASSCKVFPLGSHEKPNVPRKPCCDSETLPED